MYNVSYLLNDVFQGTQLFEIRKNRPIAGLMDTAKEIIKESLPIKCLEAVVVAMLVTILENSFCLINSLYICRKTWFKMNHVH